ncbi:YjeE family ATPase [Eggerthia catenaformis OT 569 = DSM 20559]|uniref:tRNA threonylcarbamoyladenosine biosynthesis protein TsaE n=1 Tax=Eggerthia catenaformis OT 569 = DSM 20559 TaxID=999415 RepID=M2PA74_9FIRM|nr:tRNA (adenosine(37)-N6)-threonylcarbamoyltransferase complex ATPase subunit type 1 TsaE [Eggerthia catenaformis]EMD17272.1 YjeE family ATPase [Eggerthia catenaformis OT 569 = DSM 20559]OUC51499.1 tRNA (adenosine(37)-N6)-threonylcarbamoyltransferase complex ATPase subunit type 1 TsaE [Eggerthia catenaformis]
MNIKTEEELIVFGKRLGEVLEAHTVITLNGNLGAGKTTMTKGIGQGLGVKKIINSPTFTILKVYEGRLPLYHFDAYRLEGTDDDLGFEEIFDDEGVCVIEWAEFIEEILPAERLEISIEKKDDNSRELQFVSKGRKYDKLLEELEIC